MKVVVRVQQPINGSSRLASQLWVAPADLGRILVLLYSIGRQRGVQPPAWYKGCRCDPGTNKEKTLQQ